MPDGAIGRWNAGSPLSQDLRASLRDLNRRFLDLAGSPAAGAGDRWAASARHIAALSEEQRAAAADCPYALFDLGFQDDAHWQMRLSRAAAGEVADAAASAPERGEFVQLALFYAWHVASRGALAAQLILGMHPRTAAAVARATVGRVPALAAAEAANLRVRWSESETFWSALAAAAARPDRAELRRVQLFGLQLAAAARLPRPSA